MLMHASHPSGSRKSPYPQYSQQDASSVAARRAPYVSTHSLHEPAVKQKRGIQPPAAHHDRSGFHRLIMGLLRHFRSKSNFKAENRDDYGKSNGSRYYYPSPPAAAGVQLTDWTQALAPPILDRIFSYVCPHSNDTKYETLEDSNQGDTCFLCDLRDLASCAVVRKSWYQPAQETLYKSIRLDQVHYCPLEQILRLQRTKKHGRRKSRARSHPGDEYIYDSTLDPAVDRLRLLADTLSRNAYLASLVMYIKLPSQIRDTRKMEIARLVSTCPSLRYIDLPHAFYGGDRSTDMIRSGLWTNCPDLRVMSYLPGSASHFETLAEFNRWTNLERLTIQGIRIDLKTFREAIALLPVLKSLILSELPDATDSLFTIAPGIPEFPALRTLELYSLPGITSDGLLRYLLNHHAQQRLQNLTLDKTGVRETALYEVLASAPNLLSLTVVNEVGAALPLEPLIPLTSLSLQSLHFEIRTTANIKIRPSPIESYHRYLLDSILSGSLPTLRALYVRDPSFPDALQSQGNVQSARNSMLINRNSVQSYTMPNPTFLREGDSFSSNTTTTSMAVPPQPSHSPNSQHSAVFQHSPPVHAHNPNGSPPAFLHLDPFASRSSLQVPQPRRRPASHKPRLQQPLEVFTKSQHDNIGDWLSRPLDPSPPAGADPRPMSTFNAEWGAHARRSILMADPNGGFLAVPDAEGDSSRPGSSHTVKSFRSDRPHSQAWEERWAEEEREKEKERKTKMRSSRIAPGKVGDLW